MRRAAIYARVSTFDQEPENQLAELRRYVEARGWTAFREYTDHGVSGTREKRPALDALLTDAKRRRFDVVVCWRLDRFGRNLRHLVTVLEDLRTLGVDFISLNEGIDCTTPAGKLQLHIMAALAEFEVARLRERTLAGLRRARAQGKRLGRRPVRVTVDDLARVAHLPIRTAAKFLAMAPATLLKARRAYQQSLSAESAKSLSNDEADEPAVA